MQKSKKPCGNITHSVYEMQMVWQICLRARGNPACTFTALLIGGVASNQPPSLFLFV